MTFPVGTVHIEMVDGLTIVFGEGIVPLIVAGLVDVRPRVDRVLVMVITG